MSLSFTCTKLNGGTILISGSGELFTPALSVLQKYIDAGQVLLQNESTDSISIKVCKAYRSRVDIDEVFESCRLASTKSRHYNIITVIDGKIRSIGIKEWLDLTIGRYKNAFDRSKEDRIQALRKNIDVLKMLPEVGKLIIANNDDEQILTKVDGLTQEILDVIKKKPISSLRKSDYSKEIASNENTIKSIGLEDVMVDIKSGFNKKGE